MKKSIIALAVMATMAAQAHETTLWGSVRMHYNYNDGGDANSSSTIENNGSRFGIKGSEDLGGGLSAVYAYENRIKGTLTTDKLYAGMKGSFGQITVGKQPLPTDELDPYSDPFNALTPEANLEAAIGADVDGDGEMSSARLVATDSDNSAVYWSPEMSGFQAGVGVVADGKGGVRNHADYLNVAVKYDANGFFAGLGYSSQLDKQDVDAYTLGLGYANEQFEVGLLADYYTRKDVDDIGWARLSGLYNVTPMDAVYLGFSNTFGVDGLEDSVKKLDDDWSAAVGYQHKFSKRTRTWAEYSFADNSEENQLSLGLRTDF